MFKNSFIVLLIFIQLTVLLLTLNFYLAPQTLSSHCVSGKDFTTQPIHLQNNLEMEQSWIVLLAISKRARY